jgi:bla regulator protein blaR1
MSATFQALNQTCSLALAAVANSLWPVLVVMLAAALGLRYVPRINAATRHLIWWAVLAVIIVMPAAPGLMHAWETRHDDSGVAQAIVPPATPASSATPVAGVPFAAATAASPRANGVSIHAGRWPAWIFALWLTVLIVQAGRIGWSYRYLRGIKRRAQRATPEMRRDFDVWMLACGVHRPAQFLISREIVSPMAVGFRSPAVIVPEALLSEFSQNELDHVLLHEMAHIARRDDWSNLVCRLAWAFLAMHPAAAWALRQIEREREIACDDWVVAATGEARPYAASLARLFEVCFTRRRALLATGMAERASQLGDRIEMLLRRQREFTPSVSVGRVAACAAALLLFVAAASQTPRWIALAQDHVVEPAAAPEPPALPEPPAVSQPTAPEAVPEPAAAPAPLAAPAPPAAPVSQAPPAPAAAPAPQAAPRNGSFLAALVAAGYGNLSVDDIITLKNSGVSGDFLIGIQQSGWSNLSTRDLVDLRTHGVSPSYLREIRESGLKDTSVQDLIALRDNGIDAAYVKEMESTGLRIYTIKELIDFRHHGVQAELLRALKDAGYRNAEPREIIELRDNGVGAHNLQAAREYGSSLTLRQIIRLKQAGVI